jgi:hypothetical protein
MADDTPKTQEVQKIQLRVAKYDWKSGKCPETDGYTNVLIHTQEELSPFVLRDDDGVIMENYWQFSKIYPKVHKIKQLVTAKSNKIRWAYETEMHYNVEKNISPEYWIWRSRGFKNPYWVRYPNGYGHRTEVVGSIIGKPGEYEMIGYVEARKRIYVSKYRECAVKTQAFTDLKKRFDSGEKLQIVEVDGPTYTSEYPYNLVVGGSIPITKKILTSLVNNPSQNFGHGYTLCACLMDIKF